MKRSFSTALFPLLILVGIFLVIIMSRSIFSSLLLEVEKSFSLTHTEASRLFLIMSIGSGGGMLLSGLLSPRLGYRGVVALSLACLSVILVGMASAPRFSILLMAALPFGMAGGLYPPAGIALISRLLTRRDLRKGMTIHELGPHFAMVAAPLLVNLLLPRFGWRESLAILGGIPLLMLPLLFRGLPAYKDGEEGPSLEDLKTLFRNSHFWMLILFFGLGLACIQGIYLLTPAFLVTEAGFSPKTANTLFGLSRFSPILGLLTVGFLLDRWSLRMSLFTTLFMAGVTVLLLGIVQGAALNVLVFLQPMAAALFFPAGMAALVLVGDGGSRMAPSLILPLGSLLGTGLIPNFLGFMGDQSTFAAGFCIIGAATILGSFLALGVTLTGSVHRGD